MVEQYFQHFFASSLFCSWINSRQEGRVERLMNYPFSAWRPTQLISISNFRTFSLGTRTEIFLKHLTVSNSRISYQFFTHKQLRERYHVFKRNGGKKEEIIRFRLRYAATCSRSHAVFSPLRLKVIAIKFVESALLQTITSLQEVLQTQRKRSFSA